MNFKAVVIEQKKERLLLELVNVGEGTGQDTEVGGTPVPTSVRSLAPLYDAPEFKAGAIVRLIVRPNAIEG